MKEFKEDKQKLEENIENLIMEFNKKYDVKVSDVYVVYYDTIIYNDGNYVRIKLDIKF